MNIAFGALMIISKSFLTAWSVVMKDIEEGPEMGPLPWFYCGDSVQIVILGLMR
jgi:hypothetical protein